MNKRLNLDSLGSGFQGVGLAPEIHKYSHMQPYEHNRYLSFNLMNVFPNLQLVFLTMLCLCFQALENELTNHQFRIDTVLASGQDLIDSNHYASDEIEERCEELSGSWELLMEAAAERKQKLGDALESQKVSRVRK